MEEKTIYHELLAAARTDPNFVPDQQQVGEEVNAFIERLCMAISNVDESVWNNLSEDKAQAWYNAAVEAKNALKPFPDLPGFIPLRANGTKPSRKQVEQGRGIIKAIRKVVIANPDLSYDQVKAALISSGVEESKINDNTLWMTWTDTRTILAMAKEQGWSAPVTVEQ